MRVADVRAALELYADDPRYSTVRKHMHPAAVADYIAVGDNVDDALLVMVALAALSAGKSMMVLRVEAETERHQHAVHRVTNVGEFFEAKVLTTDTDRFTIVTFLPVAAAA